MERGARRIFVTVHEENADGFALATAAGYVLEDGERVLAKGEPATP